jgi:hypothetical protein
MSIKGNRAFNRCGVKVVTFTDYVFGSPTKLQQWGELVVPEGGIGSVEKFKVENDNGVGRQYAGSSALLHCPLTEIKGTKNGSLYNNHKGRLPALASLREQVGDLLCRNCRYSVMTPVEVLEEQAKITRAEADRIEALAALERARDELRGISPYLLPPPATEATPTVE